MTTAQDVDDALNAVMAAAAGLAAVEPEASPLPVLLGLAKLVVDAIEAVASAPAQASQAAALAVDAAADVAEAAKFSKVVP